MLRPAWWAVLRARDGLAQLVDLREVEIREAVPDRTRLVLATRESDQHVIALVWRDDPAGTVSFERTGLKIQRAEDRSERRRVGTEGAA